MIKHRSPMFPCTACFGVKSSVGVPSGEKVCGTVVVVQTCRHDEDYSPQVQRALVVLEPCILHFPTFPSHALPLPNVPNFQAEVVSRFSSLLHARVLRTPFLSNEHRLWSERSVECGVCHVVEAFGIHHHHT
jgi:hypothetical protein